MRRAIRVDAKLCDNRSSPEPQIDFCIDEIENVTQEHQSLWTLISRKWMLYIPKLWETCAGVRHLGLGMGSKFDRAHFIFRFKSSRCPQPFTYITL